MSIIELIKQPWPWYVSGLAISGIMFTLIFFGKVFAMSSNFRTICAACGAGKQVKFFDFDWKAQRWNLLFTAGAILGGFIAHHFLSNNQPVAISTATVNDLIKLGFSRPTGLQPDELFSIDQLHIKNILLLMVGGLLVGFGARWAGGCTSGHAISGLSNLQVPSLISVIGFFIGGLIMTFLIFPILF